MSKIISKILVILALSVSWALIISTFVTGHMWEIDHLAQNLSTLRIWTTINRAFLLSLLFFFIGLHFIIPINKMYYWIFRKRWLVGFCILIFMTLNRYHGDSISYYDENIQTQITNEESKPIIGKTRAIRIDEFAVNTPSVLASGYGEHPYGKYNNLMRGTKTLNITNGVYAGYATIAVAPWELIYSILPREYAFSFCWYAPIILSFLLTLELLYIITNKRKLLSTTGAFLIVFSSFYLWWVFPIQLASAPGTIVCVYYFLKSNKKRQQVLLGLGIALCFSNYVVNLYPAWQVPLGYVFLAIGIWVLHENWRKIKTFNYAEWGILVCVFLIILSLIWAYMANAAEYITAINQTEYPGKRFVVGGLGINKMFYYAQAPFYAYKEIDNASEAGVFFSLFPLPSVVALICWLKQKKKDWLTGGLLLVQIPLLLYVIVGLPKVIAQISLLSYSKTSRVVDVIGMMQVYFIVIILSKYKDVKKMSLFTGIALSILTAGVSIVISELEYSGYLNLAWKLIMFLLISGLCVGLMVKLNKKMETILLLTFIGISIITGCYVRPLMKGFDAIYSKPIAKEIEAICENEPKAKWLTYGGGHMLQSYAIACGAPTLNSTNIYPNIKLWETLDPKRKYSKIYNRYAHINIKFTDSDTSFEEIQADYFTLNLSYKDIKKIEATHLLVMGEVDFNVNNDYVTFKKEYEQDGIVVFKLIPKHISKNTL